MIFSSNHDIHIYTRKLYNMLLNNAIYFFVSNLLVVMEVSSKQRKCHSILNFNAYGTFFFESKKSFYAVFIQKKGPKMQITFCPQRYKIAPGAKKNSLHFVRCFFYLEIYSKAELNSCFMLSLYRAFIFSKKSSETSLTPTILISEADKKYMRQ